MRHCRTFRRILMTAVLVLVLPWCTEELARGQGGRDTNFEYGPAESLSQILGRPSGDSVTLSVLSASDLEAYVEFGDEKGDYSRKTDTLRSNAGSPLNSSLNGCSLIRGTFIDCVRGDRDRTALPLATSIRSTRSVSPAVHSLLLFRAIRILNAWARCSVRTSMCGRCAMWKKTDLTSI